MFVPNRNHRQSVKFCKHIQVSLDRGKAHLESPLSCDVIKKEERSVETHTKIQVVIKLDVTTKLFANDNEYRRNKFIINLVFYVC